jgi:hypothetical protein
VGFIRKSIREITMLRVAVRWTVIGVVGMCLASCTQQPNQQPVISTGKEISNGADESRSIAQKATHSAPIETTVKDLIDASFSESDRSRLDGKMLRVTGFYQPQDANSASLSIYIFHCCTADILPVKIKLKSEGKVFEKHNKSTWVEIRGHASFVENGDSVKWFDPIVSVPSTESIVSILPPNPPWLDALGKNLDPDRYGKWQRQYFGWIFKEWSVKEDGDNDK